MDRNYDCITEADVAAGFLRYYDGWKAGINYEKVETGEHLRGVLEGADNQITKAFLTLALTILEMDYYIDPSWLADLEVDPIDPDEDPFNEWRKTHPRDHSSPQWKPK